MVVRFRFPYLTVIGINLQSKELLGFSHDPLVRSHKKHGECQADNVH